MPTKIPSIEIDWSSIRKTMAPLLQRAPEFVKRFAEIPTRFEQLKAKTLATVNLWECHTYCGWNLDPSYFLLDGYLRPGRRLKADPGPDNMKVLRYGFDKSGRIVVERCPSNAQETFLEYQADRIDGLSISTNSPPDSEYFRFYVKSLFLENGQPVGYFQHSRHGVHLRRFQYEDGRIVQVLTAYGNDESGPDPDKGWFFEFADINYDTKGDAHVRRFSRSGDGYAHIYKMPRRAAAKKAPVLDLRKDVQDVVSLIKKTVKKFSARQQKSGEVVSGIGLDFFAFENPEVIFQFDTRDKFEPDGTWTHPEFARLKRPRWNKFIEACEDTDGKGAVIDAQGNRHDITEIEQEKRLVNWIGETMVAALKSARAAGVFDQLSQAARCELGVEEAADGEFGWPHYEDRGQENLV